MIKLEFVDHRQCMGGWVISPDLCRALIQDFINKKNHWNKAHTTRGYYLVSSHDMSPTLLQAYEMSLDEVVKKYTYYFPYTKEGMCAWARDPNYNFQYYEPGSSYSNWHCENNGEPRYQTRHLAFMTYLNTVENGGQTHFLHQNLMIKPEIGLTLVWPAAFTHTHRGIPAKTEEKYITTGWYNFIDTKKILESTENLSDADFYNTMDNVLSKVT